jgi:hypothetical protein
MALTTITNFVGPSDPEPEPQKILTNTDKWLIPRPRLWHSLWVKKYAYFWRLNPEVF